jgi:hypothetical protein
MTTEAITPLRQRSGPPSLSTAQAPASSPRATPSRHVVRRRASSETSVFRFDYCCRSIKLLRTLSKVSYATITQQMGLVALNFSAIG